MTQLLEKQRIDDPCGAIPVHLGCGFWGTVAVGIFSNDQLSLEYRNLPFNDFSLTGILFQVLGWIIVCVFTALFSWLILLSIGLIFYYGKKLNHSLKNKTNQGTILKKKLTQKFNLVNLHQKVREGLRVSVEQEKNGGDVFFD